MLNKHCLLKWKTNNVSNIEFYQTKVANAYILYLIDLSTTKRTLFYNFLKLIINELFFIWIVNSVWNCITYWLKKFQSIIFNENYEWNANIVRFKRNRNVCVCGHCLSKEQTANRLASKQLSGFDCCSLLVPMLGWQWRR